MTLEKKKKAALAAVMQYLQTEREQMVAAAVAPVVAIPDHSVSYPARPWGLSGRSASMQTRTMMYYRALRG